MQDGRLCCNYDFRCSSPVGQSHSITAVNDDSRIGAIDDSDGSLIGLSLKRENVSEIGPPQAQIRETNDSDSATDSNVPGGKNLSEFKSDGDENTQNIGINDTMPLFVTSATEVVYTGVSELGTEEHVNETEQKTNTTDIKNNGNQNEGSTENGRPVTDNSHVQKRETIMKQASGLVFLTEEEKNAQVEEWAMPPWWEGDYLQDGY